jgi:hypothetical protein
MLSVIMLSVVVLSVVMLSVVMLSVVTLSIVMLSDRKKIVSGLLLYKLFRDFDGKKIVQNL